jgi:hypothetical protein
MSHVGDDPAIAHLPEDLSRLYSAAERLIGWCLNTNGMLLVKPTERKDIKEEDRDSKRYAGLVVTNLARIATDLDSLKPMVKAAEARLVRARQGQPYRWAGNVRGCAHQATLVVARDLLGAVVNACHGRRIMIILDHNGPPTYDAQLDHYRKMLTEHEVLVADDKAGPAWEEFCQRYRVCKPSWDSSDIEAELRGEVILGAEQNRLEGAAPPPGTRTRLSFDDSTRTVTLDGKLIEVENPKAYAIYKVIVTRGADKPTITKEGIRRKVPGTDGTKTIPNHIEKLPRTLKNTINTSTQGYSHRLPDLSEKSRTGPE